MLSPTSDLCLPWTFLTISAGFPWMGIAEGGYNPHPCVVSSRVKAKTSSLVQSAASMPQDNCEWGPTQNGNYRTECILRVFHLFYFFVTIVPFSSVNFVDGDHMLQCQKVGHTWWTNQNFSLSQVG